MMAREGGHSPVWRPTRRISPISLPAESQWGTGVRVVVTAISLLGIVCVRQVSGQTRFPIEGTGITVVTMTAVVSGLPLGVLVDGRVRSDGAVCVADHTFARVSCFSAQGGLLWHFGRKGGGPGEFQIPYRIAEGPGRSLYVYDLGTRAITVISAKGSFVARHQVELGLSQVTSLNVSSDSTIQLAGYAPGAGVAGDSGVHVFDGAFVHLRSVAPLPVARDPTYLGYWGSGSLTKWGTGMVYLRRIPYEIYVMDGRGRTLQRHLIQKEVSPVVDDAFILDKRLSSRSIRPSTKPFIAPGIAFPIGRRVLLIVRIKMTDGRAVEQWWDAVSVEGRLLGSTQAPPALVGASFIGPSPDGGSLWFTGETPSGQPALWRLSLTHKNAP